MSRRATIIGYIMLIAFIGILSPVYAQTDRGTIEGLVTDPTGASVPNAQVKIVRLETNDVIQLATNGAGRYFAPNLPGGTYRVSVEKEGFRAARQGPIQVQAQSSIRADFALEIGSVTETVKVTGQAPMLDASTTTSSTTLTTKLIDDLPLISIGQKRNITDYLRFMPGTTTGTDTWNARVYGSRMGAFEQRWELRARVLPGQLLCIVLFWGSPWLRLRERRVKFDRGSHQR